MVWTILQNVVNCLFLVLCLVTLSIVVRQGEEDKSVNNAVDLIDLVREENRKVIANNTTYLENRINELGKSQNDYQISTSKKITLLESKIELKQNSKQLLVNNNTNNLTICLLYTSPSPRDRQKSRMPSSA